MTATTPTAPHYSYEECLRTHRCWGWFLALGVLLIIVGIMAIGASWQATFATIVVFGWLMIAGGIVEIVNAFFARGWRGFFVLLLAGILNVVVGVLFLDKPLMTAEVVTLMIAIVLLVGGIARIIFTLFDHFPGWGWALLDGAISTLLGLAIWRQWPLSGLWVIGLFVGINLIFTGWSWVMLGIILRGAHKRAAATPA
jgi:uncharacterized membrane protein HdeD (DUF308 family)